VTLLRLAQLGAALDVFLIVGAQRFGAELGQMVTALRAQLTGRVCMHVSDKETAVMVLGDLWPEAVEVAQLIGVGDRGIAVAADGDGGWVRVRAVLTSVEEAAAVAMATAQLTPVLPGIDRPWSRFGGEE
jgi:S-DNA-T family DNA segregation ATPase FtsK/SpoIIIE